MQQRNVVIFLVASFTILFGWLFLQRWLNPPKPKPAAEEQAKKEEPKPEEKRPAPSPPPRQKEAEPTPAADLVPLGGDDFNLKVLLDPRGGAVRSVVLTQYQKADDQGKPVPGEKLELVPAAANAANPSNLLYHYPEKHEQPEDTLGKVVWKGGRDPDDSNKVVFTYDGLPDVVLTKTYRLAPGDYHIALEVKVERKPGKPDGGEVKFRYQLASGHGLPIEGSWYTSTLRNAVAGLEDNKGYLAERKLQELRSISHKQGGDPFTKEKDQKFVYAGVAGQYFVSLVVLDDEQDADKRPVIARAQPTVELGAVRGRITEVNPLQGWFKLAGDDKGDYQFFFADPALTVDFLEQRRPGQEVVVRYRIQQGGLVAAEVLAGEAANRLFFDDIAVRMVTEPFPVRADAPVVHRYLLYNGPVKVRLLAHQGVSQGLIDRYEDKLHLNSLTDYPSSGPFGWISDKVGWTKLLIWCTNLMHWVLGLLHTYVMPWSYGLCIIMLTVLVRGMMFPLSRKNALMSMKMQALAPEIKKLQEKYKNDRQALGMAQMQLYRKHGINPLGTCWVLLLQMPIFLGLYYALQESVDFRLSSFLWIENLAAPDMLLRWGSSIPWVSRPEDYGGWLYLGPYFNLLPVIAVSFMLVQQSLMMPPPADEQQAMQQKMMKYMMVFFGFMFYKVAAGLCVYFIASTLWGFAERKLLPKKKDGVLGEPKESKKPGFFQKLLDQLDEARKQQASRSGNGAPAAGRGEAVTATPPAPGPAAGGPAKRKKRKQARDKRGPAVPAPAGPEPAPRSWWAGVREWWSEVLKKAEKK